MFIEHLLCERLYVKSWVCAVWWCSLASYNPYGCKESDITEQLNNNNFSKPVVYYKVNCAPSGNIWQCLETFLVVMIVGVMSEWVSKSHSVVSDSLWPCGLYGPWNSPGQNTRVDSHSLLQEIFQTQGSNPGLMHCKWILYQLSDQGSATGI